MTDPNEQSELLTTAETAKIFRVARSTVISWARQGLLPYMTTPSGHLRFHRDTVQRFLREHHAPNSKKSQQ
jgi:excisionase family DNA binding protein